MSLMDSREFVIQQAENLAQSLKENHVLMGKNEELVKENLTVQKQLSACQQECQRLRSQAFAAGRAAASHATQNDEKVALKLEAYEELEAEAARTNNMLRKALNSLTASSAEKDQLLAEHRRCLEEKAALGQQLEHLSHHTAQQRTAWSTEANALRRQLEQYQNAGQNKDEKFRAAQAMIGNLQAQLAEKSQTLEECQQLVVELQVAQTDIHMENNLAIDKLVDSERTALQELEHAQAQFRSAQSEVEQLKETVSKQEKEIEHQRAKHTQATEGSSQTAHVDKTYCSVSVEAVPQEAPKVVRPTSDAGASGSTAKAQRPKRPLKRSHSEAHGASSQNKPLDLAKFASRLPDLRRGLLETFPEIPVALPTDTENVTFNRPGLVHILGGTTQSLIVRVTKSATPLASNHNIDAYLCPNMDHNPWVPTGPGKHGFMQVGLGREKTAFNTPEIRHVFVGAGKRLKYCGLYEVSRVDPLSIAEWGSLPEKVRKTYVKTTASKEKHENHGTEAQIRTKYDSGVLLAPCVLLRCVEFDIKFYGELVAAMDQHVSQGNAKKPRLAAPRAEQDDDSQDEADDDEVVFADDTGGQTNQEPPSGVSSAMAARSPRRSGRLSIRLPARRSNYSEDSPDDGER